MCEHVAPAALVLHTTSKEDAEAAQERFPRRESVILPNGVDIPDQVEHVNASGILRLLYLGRLHPKKGIENLLQACKWLKDNAGLSWSLAIAGTGDLLYVDSLQAKIDELGLRGQRKDIATQELLPGQVEMVGEVIGKAKERLFANADLLVVPSYVENFGNVVAEALARAVPVIASRGTPWSKVEEIGCGLWVDNDPASLAQAIRQMSRLPLRDMGGTGRAWMQREFGWRRHAQEMLACYERLSDRPPSSTSWNDRKGVDQEETSATSPSHRRADRHEAA